MRRYDESGSGTGLFGLLLALVIVLGLIWYMFGGSTAPTTTATTPTDTVQPVKPVQPTPPATTPITPSAPK